VNQPTASVMTVRSAGLGPAGAPRGLFAVPLLAEERLDLLRGMLCRLADATSAGQQYLMEKFLPLLRTEALDPGKKFRPGDLDVITRSLADLEHEASRVAPDPSTFGHKAQLLVDVFAIA